MASKKTKKSHAKKNLHKEEITQDKPAVSSIILDPELSIKTIGALRDELSELYSCENEITIDASAVNYMDTSAIQLLVAFNECITKRSKKLNWKDVSDAFSTSFSELGFHNYLNLENTDTDSDDDDLCPVF